MRFVVSVHNVEPQSFIGLVFLALVGRGLDIVFEIVIGDRDAQGVKNGGEILTVST